MICEFLMADLKEQHIYVKFCSRLTKTALEMHEMLKRAFGGGEHRFLRVFFSVNIWGNFG
jgi:hypothetical protein